MAVDPREKIRAFLALPLAEAFESWVQPVIEKLRTQYPEVKWVQPNQIHVTLHFFGQVETNEIPTISDCVLPVTSASKPLDLFLKGIGAFPNLERPRVIWAGIEGEVERLGELHKNLEDRFQKAGFPCEGRMFKPHLTLGRMREGKRLASFRIPEFGPTERKQISELILYKSTLTPAGPVYEKVQTYPLSAA